MFSDYAGFKREGFLVTFSKIFLDVFKLDLLDQHRRSKFQNRKNFSMAEQCGPYLRIPSGLKVLWLRQDGR